jgi:hypothetical protein
MPPSHHLLRWSLMRLLRHTSTGITKKGGAGGKGGWAGAAPSPHPPLEACRVRLERGRREGARLVRPPRKPHPRLNIVAAAAHTHPHGTPQGGRSNVSPCAQVEPDIDKTSTSRSVAGHRSAHQSGEQRVCVEAGGQGGEAHGGEAGLGQLRLYTERGPILICHGRRPRPAAASDRPVF